MSEQRIIMNFTVPPGIDDLQDMTEGVIASLPEELEEYCEGLAVRIEEIADESTEQDLDLDDPFDLLALYRNGKELSPGVETKTANDDDLLIVYRRPVLDMWCDTQDDLETLLRQVVIEELGRHFDFSDDEIEEMSERHYQGML